MLALRDRERNAVEHHALAALDGDIPELDEWDAGHGIHIVNARRAALGRHSVGEVRDP